MYETVKLPPGIVTLTFTCPEGQEADAIIRPVVPLASRHALSLMYEPGNLSGALMRPGEFCVIRVGQTAVLGIEIVSQSGSGAPRGSIALAYLSTRGPDPVPAPPGATDFVLHLAGYGDRPGRFGGWVGGDTPDHPVAGLMIRPRAGQPRLMLQDLSTGQTCLPGEFLGSQGGFRPLTDLRIWIEDPDGLNRLEAQAEYAQAGKVQASGTMVSLHGAGPQDRLLRLNLSLPPMPAGSRHAHANGPARRGDRIKIFRKPN